MCPGGPAEQEGGGRNISTGRTQQVAAIPLATRAHLEPVYGAWLQLAVALAMLSFTVLSSNLAQSMS